MYITIRRAQFPTTGDGWSGSLPNAVMDAMGRPRIIRIESHDTANTEDAWISVWYEAYS